MTTAGEAGEMIAARRPAAVRGNEWPSLDIEPADRFVPRHPVSVIVTYFEAPEALALTLAALEGQSYPNDLFEVVIVDDGSRTPLAAPSDTPLKLRVVHQEDQGFGLARARNTGARAASHEILVFLDCDMMPEAGWLAAHARWHHAASDALTLGFRAHVDVAGIDAETVRRRPASLDDLFAGRPVQRPEWIEGHMERTENLTSDADDLFRVVTGGNLGVSRDFFEAVGGYDESFTRWGAEDTEFGYRASTRGGLLVPVPEAMCWHQGEGAEPSESEVRSLELQRAKISQLIAHHGFRRAVAGRSFTVPQYVVTLRPSESVEIARMETVEQVLASTVHDLVVWLEEPAGCDSDQSFEHQRLRGLFGGDPRVRFGVPGGAVAAFPAAAFHITIPADATVAARAVSNLRQLLGLAPAASTNPVDHLSGVSIVRARALHRAARHGLTLAECEAVTPLDPSEVDVSDPNSGTVAPPRPSLGQRVRSRRRLARRLARRTANRLRKLRLLVLRNSRRGTDIGRAVAREGSRIRSLADAKRFSGWAAGSVVTIARKRMSTAASTLGQQRKANYRLGPEAATVGPVAAAVFASATEVGRTVGPHTQVVIADTPEMGRGMGVDTVVALSELEPMASVPAFDPERLNPWGWKASHRRPHAALSRTRVLGMDPDRLRKLRQFHHVTDSARMHSDAASRAGVLAAVAAIGAVVRVTDPDPELARRLGPDLYSLMTDERVTAADAHEREALSVAMRRCALRDHSLRARARQVLAGTGLPCPALPRVSVLLATRRPHRLAAAVEAVAGQTYPNLELVVAAHGEGFNPRVVEELIGSLDLPASAIAVAGHKPLGTVLNAALAKSSGNLVTKFDDDDFYGPEHLWDLVLAYEYSRRCLVGKAAEYVHLAHSDRTIHRFRDRSERRSAGLAGGAMMISRRDLDRFLGWREIPAGVDRALIEDVKRTKREIYRTHGRGYMLVRHNDGHTWPAKDAYFLKQADEIREGCDLAFAGVA